MKAQKKSHLDSIIKLIKAVQELEFEISDEELDGLVQEIDQHRTKKQLNIGVNSIENNIALQLLNAAPDAMVGINEKHEIVLFNKQAETLFGYTYQEIIYQNLNILIPKNYRHTHQNFVGGYFEKPQYRQMGGNKNDLEAVNKAGEKFPVDISLSYITTSTGKIAISAIRDITEKLKLERDISLVGAKLKDIAASVPGIIFQAYVNENGKFIFTYVSERASLLWGVPPDDLCRDSELFFDNMHPEDAARTKKYIKDTNAGGILFSNYFRIPQADGTVKWFHTTGMTKKFDKNIYIRSGYTADITSEKNAEQQLSINENRYRMILETTDEIINTVAPDGKIMWVNNAWKKNLHYSDEEIKDLYLADILPPEFRDGYKDRLRRLRAGETIHNLKAQLIAKSGNYVDVRGTIVPIYEYGEFRGTQGFFRNVMDVNLERANRIKAETQLQRTLDNMPIGCMLVAQDWTYLYVNETAAKQAFQIPATLLGKTMLEMYPGVEKTNVFKMYERCMKERTHIEFEEHYVYFNGIIKWYEFKVDPIEEGIFIMTIDITEKKEAKLTSRINEQKYQQVVENISDALMIDDVNGKVIFANMQFLQLFGLTKDDLDFLIIDDFVAPEYRSIIRERHNRRMLDEQVTDFYEFEGMRKDGTRLWLDIRVTKIIENEQIVGTQSAIRDINARKQAEQQLAYQNTELKKIKSELDRFVYSASHELRAPLMSLLGVLNICEETNQLDDFSLYFPMMRRSVNKLDNTIMEIIAYSQNSRMELLIEHLDINSIVQNSIENSIDLTSTKKINFEVLIDENQPFYSDKIRVSNIINNLITNAVLYQRNEEPNPLVKISFFATPTLGTLVVEDNGEGIQADKLEKIFEMFYRNSVKSIGSGLGLFICKEIIEKMGGARHVHSVRGKGSIFTIQLPNQMP